MNAFIIYTNLWRKLIMKKKIFGALSLVCLLGIGLVGTNINASAASENVRIKKEVALHLYLDSSVTSDIIDMYESSGWTYNPDDKELVKKVSYANSPVVIDGKEYETDARGTVKMSMGKKRHKKINVESYTGRDSVGITVNQGEEITITENASVNSLMKSMDLLEVSETNETGKVQIGQSDGEKPKKGAIVACNRFNGHLGNGRYYSNQFKAQAIKNFWGSDCDWALAKYANCLLDEQPIAKYRYCSLYSSKNYGRCSALARKANGKSHSKYFHMHKSYKN